MYRNVLAAVALLAVGAAASYAADRAERVSALDTSGYTSIGRLYFNNAGASSFVRFWNSSGQATDFEAKIVGGETGADYAPGKTYRVTVPDKASLQKSLEDIRANITSQGGPDITPKSGDTFLTLYVKNDKAGAGVGFQNVSYNGTTGFFENQSICTYDPTQDYSAGNRRLINVHTSQLAAYPSKIEIRNPDAVSRAVRGKVYDAVTGTSLGAFTVNPPANGSSVLDAAAVEQMTGFRPGASQLQVNIEFETADSSAYSAVVGHLVTQASTGATFNLTQACALNPARTTSAPTTPSGSCSSNPSGCTTPLSGAPVANADALTQPLTVGKLTRIDFATLIANDSNATGATLWAVSPLRDSNGISNGDFGLSTSGISFQPVRAGPMSFTYNFKLNAGTANEVISSTATVTLNVVAAGDTVGTPATARDDTLTGTFKVGQMNTINLSALTANDTLPALAGTTGYVFSGVSLLYEEGTTTLAGGFLVYNDHLDFWPDHAGRVTFTYIVKGFGTLFPDSNIATVTLTVVP